MPGQPVEGRRAAIGAALAGRPHLWLRARAAALQAQSAALRMTRLTSALSRLFSFPAQPAAGTCPEAVSHTMSKTLARCGQNRVAGRGGSVS